jgi:hypothetical protein
VATVPDQNLTSAPNQPWRIFGPEMMAAEMLFSFLSP